jgi:hypothetical protein
MPDDLDIAEQAVLEQACVGFKNPWNGLRLELTKDMVQALINWLKKKEGIGIGGS